MSRCTLWRTATAVLLAGLIAACGDSSPTEVEHTDDESSGPERQPQKAWTFLFYDDAEFTGYDPLEAFRSRMQSGENLHVIVLQDDESAVATTYFISDSGEARPVYRNGEVNMGDGQTLEDFLAFGKEYYPADRYVVAFYDHGAAWQGSCMDVSSGNDMLTIRETREALARGGGVDLVLFSAPCNMGSFEAAYDLRDVTEVYIGSPNTSGYIWWIDPMADLSVMLKSEPEIGSEELARRIITSIWEHRESVTPDLWQDNLTMTAVRTEGLERVAQALDAASSQYLHALFRCSARRAYTVHWRRSNPGRYHASDGETLTQVLRPVWRRHRQRARGLVQRRGHHLPRRSRALERAQLPAVRRQGRTAVRAVRR